MNKSEIREEIIRESTELFLRYGIRSVSMDDIARHLSISKKTIYQYFSDKEELILNVTRNYLEEEMKELEEIASGSGNTIEHLHRIGLCLRQKMQNLHHNLLFDLEKYHRKAWSLYLAFKNDYIFNGLCRILHKGIQEGYFRPEIRPEILAKLRIEQIQLSLNAEVFPRDEFELTEIQDQLYQHFIHGILTEKGLRLFKTYHAKTTVDERTA
jgi:TetR/AcrR family transcriptional regulator, cholesterol catabolism regulator